MTQKDEEGNFSWVEFEPGFHPRLVKRAFSLLSAPITHSTQKLRKKGHIYFHLRELLNGRVRTPSFLKRGDAKENRAARERKRLAGKRRRATKRERIREDDKFIELLPLEFRAGNRSHV